MLYTDGNKLSEPCKDTCAGGLVCSSDGICKCPDDEIEFAGACCEYC